MVEPHVGLEDCMSCIAVGMLIKHIFDYKRKVLRLVGCLVPANQGRLYYIHNYL